MRLAIVCKDVFYLIVNRVSLLCTSFFYYLDATEGLNSALQQLVSLKANDEFVVLVDVTSFVRTDG